MPALRTATAVTTGTPSAAESFGDIDVDAAALRDVEHVEHQRQRAAGALELEQQADGEPQIGGVGDAQHEIGRGFAREAAEHDVAGDVFVRAAAAQRIGAGQIDHADLPSVRA